MLAYSGFFLFISNKIKSAFVTLTVMSLSLIHILAMIATMPKEIMDGNYLYLEDGGKIPVYSRKLSARYIDKMENAVHGIASWTKQMRLASSLSVFTSINKFFDSFGCFVHDAIP